MGGLVVGGIFVGEWNGSSHDQKEGEDEGEEDDCRRLC